MCHKNWNVGCYVSAPSVTWKAPRPQWNQTDPNDIRTVDKRVLNGSTQVPLRWSYTLLSGSMTSIIFSIRLKDGSFSDIGMISGGKIVIFDNSDFRTRFDISVREQATLIINSHWNRRRGLPVQGYNGFKPMESPNTSHCNR